MSNVERVTALRDQGCNCCQSVCAGYAEQFGLDRDLALKISTGFGGGMGHLANTCGVVSGAFMILGLKYGSSQVGDKPTKEKVYEYVREFAEKFTARNGSVMCRDLLGYDISTPEGYAQAKEKNLFETRCSQLVRDSAELLEEMLG